MKCSKGHENAVGSQFCATCGEKLATQDVPPPPPGDAAEGSFICPQCSAGFPSSRARYVHQRDGHASTATAQTPPAAPGGTGGTSGETREQYLARINASKLGAPEKKKQATPSQNGCAIGCGILILLVIIGAIASAFGLSGGSDDSSSDSVTGDAGQEVSIDRAGAADVCEQFVRDRLKAPDTATFRDPYGDQIFYTGDGEGPITVDASVDSENSFGANLRSTYTCTVSHAGSDDTWNLVDLQLNDGGG